MKKPPNRPAPAGVPRAKAGRVHYAWVILGCCICLSFGCGGLVQSTNSNFVTPVVTDLGSSVSAFTLYVSIEAAVMACLYPFATRLLSTRHIGKVLAASAALQFLAVGLMSVYPSVGFFYLSGALLGVGASVTSFMAIPILVNMWFHQKVGMAISISTAFNRVSTILFSLVSAALITGVGWRLAYLIMALIGAVLTIPAMLLLVKRPQDVGYAPYGAQNAPTKAAATTGPAASEAANASASAEDRAPAASGAPPAEAWGLTLRQALKSPVLYLVWFTCLIFSACAGLGGYMATFATMELGFSTGMGAAAVAVINVGSVVCYLAMGWLNDKYGVTAGLAWGCGFMAAGMAVLWASIYHTGLLFAGCLLLGLGNGLYHVEAPLLVRGVLGSRHYASIWPIVMMGNSFIGALTYSSIGLFYDVGGSYRYAFLTGIVLLVAAFVIGCLSISLGKKLMPGAGGAAAGQ